MASRTLQQWLRAESIDWDIFWRYVDTLDQGVKRNRPPGSLTPGGWKWPPHTYDCSNIFRARFNLDGTVRRSYAQIAAQTDVPVRDKAGFVAGIIRGMLRVMNHPYRRMHWDKKMKCPYCQQ
ncbi:MAG: hypothetical protein BA872_02920 [Desulfobacterales bacterium C00003060]|nr:MAG: hypothetical protein BA861_05235 [Desulfobacterales bacterium S3730MH5]OEU79944.1 MAG: hypothetical protein BA872_02920 [Desulfobacterales bacterium C00003060]OEU82039.1 MAG: hypothetical protein BA865_06375 [Desulfobacterales bacterium S5133MH4]